MNLNHRQQLLGLLAIVAVVLLAGDRLVARPLWKLWKERGAENVELRKSVTDGFGTLSNETAIRARWTNMVSNAFTNDLAAAESQMLRAFERWSAEARVGITSVKPQRQPPAGDTTTLECRVDAFGDLGSLARFIYDLEKDPLALRVQVVEIASRDDNGSQLTLGLLVSGLIFNLPQSR